MLQPRLADEYAALEETLLLPGRRGLFPSSTTGAGGGSGGFAVLQGALARARELDRRANGQYLRVEWGSLAHTSPGHGVASFGSPGAAATAPGAHTHAPADADLVVALFFHLCDELAGKAGAAPGEAPSETLYAPDVAAALAASARGGGGGGGRGALGVVGILRQEVATARPQFNVFSADRAALDVLEVDEGRQNCFEAVAVFLLESLRVAVAAAGPPPASSSVAAAAGGDAGQTYSPWKQQQQLRRRPPPYASSLDPHRSPYTRPALANYGDDGRWGMDGPGGSGTEVEAAASERAPALSAVVRELALEVFQARDVDSLLQHLSSLGMDVY